MSLLKDFLFGKKPEDKDFKEIEKLDQSKGLVIVNPNSPIPNTSSSPVEVPKVVEKFDGRTGLQKFQNFLATSTTTDIDLVGDKEENRQVREYDHGVGGYVSDEQRRTAVERLREYEHRSYADCEDIESLSQLDPEIEEDNRYKDKKIIRIN